MAQSANSWELPIDTGEIPSGNSEFDAIVVGGGPGGSAAAGYLAMAGKSVLLLEKGLWPRDKICGDAVGGKSLGHVKALVVKDNKVIAKEGRQGTKKMLSNLKKNSGGILIKFPKKRQDLRMDLPTIGLQTLKDCKKYGLKGIVMKSKKNIFLDKIQCIKFANKRKIFISVR